MIQINKIINAGNRTHILILYKVKVKVSHRLLAVGAVGLESHCILGTADKRRSPSLSFRCLISP